MPGNNTITTDFIHLFTVPKEEVTRLRTYNQQKMNSFGYLGTPGISKLVEKFLVCEEISVLRSCEGYFNSPRSKHRKPSISFLSTPTGLNDLLCYLEQCRIELAANSDLWVVSFMHKLVDDTTVQTVTWSLSKPVNKIRKKHIIDTMCDEFDLYFGNIKGDVHEQKEEET